MIGPFTFLEGLGAVLTCSLVAFAYLRSSVETKNNNAVFAGLTGTVLTLLLSMRLDLLPTIQEDLRLRALADSSPEAQQLYSILSTAPGGNGHPLMRYVLQVRLNSLDEYFDRATHGRFVVDQAELPQFLLAMLRSAKNQILATSYAQPSIWWDQPWGQSYEDENERAVKRGVTVARTFLFANDEERKAIEHWLSKETAAGISVKCALVSNLHADLVNGLVVIDDTLAGELHLTPEKGVKEAEFYTRPTDIENIKRKIERVALQARDFKNIAAAKGF